MKKGCFLTVIIVLTIILSVSFYFIKFYGEDIIDFGKDHLIEFAQNKIINDLDELDDSKYVDSLKIVVNNYFQDLENIEIEKEIKRIEEFSDNFEVILLDSKIDSLEFEFITNILFKHDKRKEN